MNKQELNNVVPLRDSIICEITVKASKAGIILSNEAKENVEHILTAVRIGPDVKQVQIKDVLLVNPYEFMNNKIRLDDDHLLISETVVIAVKRPK